MFLKNLYVGSMCGGFDQGDDISLAYKLWDVQAKSCIAQFHVHFSIGIRVIREVPQIEIELWVWSFFEKPLY